MTINFIDICKFNELPFFFRALGSPKNNDGLPDALPFWLAVDKNTGLVKQIGNKVLSDSLSRAYSYGSEITGMMDDYGIGKEYAADFFNYCLLKIGEDKIRKSTVLEIGCGTGYLLSLFKESGALKTVGIEPGLQGVKNLVKWEGSKIIRDFYPCKEIENEKFDIIIACNVIEHIENLQDFLENIQNSLAQNGILILSVPSCEEYIKEGNISMLIHEHYSYFDINSLYRTLYNSFKYKYVSIENSNFGGALYAFVDFGKSANAVNCILPIDCIAFKNSILAHINNIKHTIKEAQKIGSVGIYVPNRVMNVIFIIKDEIDMKKIRFFDDNISSLNKYLPGIDVIIESGQDIVKNTPDTIVIASKTFKDRIYNKVCSLLNKPPNVITL